MRGRFRTFALLIAALLLLAATVAPAGAITEGEPDGDGHPAVVLIIMDVGGSPAFRCTGTLLSPTMVLTAGHCTGEPGDFTGLRIFTEADVQNGTNNYPFGGPNSIEAKRWAAHPAYTNAAFFLHDVGMIELKKPFKLDGSDYGVLPARDSLDSLVPVNTTFTSVGYGLQRIAGDPQSPNAKPPFEGQRIRMYANPRLLQINTGFTGDFSMLLSNNHSTGGTCFGDSGGPNYLGDTNVVAGVTSFGLNNSCGGTGGVFRVDRSDVLQFVSDFMSKGPKK
jgi:secreted trypsin-like serine protease